MKLERLDISLKGCTGNWNRIFSMQHVTLRVTDIIEVVEMQHYEDHSILLFAAHRRKLQDSSPVCICSILTYECHVLLVYTVATRQSHEALRQVLFEQQHFGKAEVG